MYNSIIHFYIDITVHRYNRFSDLIRPQHPYSIAMSCPSKRKLSSGKAAAAAAAAHTRKRILRAATKEFPDIKLSEGEHSSLSCPTGGESIADSETEVSDAEDNVLPIRIGQPKTDWKEAERGIHG